MSTYHNFGRAWSGRHLPPAVMAAQLAAEEIEEQLAQLDEAIKQMSFDEWILWQRIGAPGAGYVASRENEK